MKIKLINKDSYLFTILFNRLYKLQVERVAQMTICWLLKNICHFCASETFFPSDKPHESEDKSHEGMIKRYKLTTAAAFEKLLVI